MSVKHVAAISVLPPSYVQVCDRKLYMTRKNRVPNCQIHDSCLWSISDKKDGRLYIMKKADNNHTPENKGEKQ